MKENKRELDFLKREIEALKSRENTLLQENHKLQKELEKYEMAASGASDGLWDWDLETNETFISPPWREMLGYSEDDVHSRLGEWENLLHPDDRELATHALREYIDGKSEKYDVVFRLKNKQGNYRWIRSRATVLRNMSGHPVRISGSHTDITESKKAEEALYRSEKKFRNLFENSLVAMFRSDAHTGKFIEANQKTLELFEIDSIEGVYTTQFYVEGDACDNLIKALREKENVESQEIQLRTAAGKLIWVSFSARLYKEEGYIEAVLKDITDSKENLLELQRLNFELDNFVYHASHDLRSPLRSIMGLVNILKSENQPSARQKCIEMIEGSINRLDKFVVDLLSMSRANRIKEEVVPINFMIEINNSFTNFFHASTIKNLMIQTSVKHAIPFNGPVTQVRVILNNLISNAIKYRRHDIPLSLIQVNVEVQEDKVLLSVSDNGEGIPEEKLPHIFDMFYRASESSEGSGLGMYIVKNIINKIGGEISLQSKVGEGSTFSVVLPNTPIEEE
ncbi:PAS domain S-box protein [Cytophagales bacterium LB-30]|uniref:histidine kinase n=1 Tax=Shiella aurantiaca TaxID=3058365 RepID=A0ABT8F2T5_9BACT|nr:PAS domain S-box protein [Shiella aurantiaca]MDN4164767.1 PAS domain S-box protein [Shiella aurantiaca]